MLEVLKWGEYPFFNHPIHGAVSEADYDRTFYFRGLHEGLPYLFAHAQVYNGQYAIIHAYAVKFGREILRTLLEDFKCLRRLLKQHGIKFLIGLREVTNDNAEDLKIWLKFVSLVGFEVLGEVEGEGKFYKRAVMEV